MPQGDDYLIGEDGISKQKFPNHWKGRHGLYCAGLVRKGIYGLANDAEKIANDINTLLKDDDAKKMNWRDIYIQSYTHMHVYECIS